MGKYNIAVINKLNQCLSENGIEKTIHKKIMESGELIKGSSKPEELSEWCFNAMTKMDKLLDENIIKKVREDCACLKGGQREKLCEEINKKFTKDEDRIKAVNESHFVFGHEIKMTGKGKYEVKFKDDNEPEKKCDCLGGRLNGLNKNWSKTWCYCCGGQVKNHLEVLLGRKFEVKIITTALSKKGKNCYFELIETKKGE
jgi:hypothetical protein